MSFREKILAGVAVALGLGALGFALLGDQGVREVRRLRAERQELLGEIQRLREQEKVLDRRVSDLRDNRSGIEAKARSELGMIKKDETVFLLPERHGRKP